MFAYFISTADKSFLEEDAADPCLKGKWKKMVVVMTIVNTHPFFCVCVQYGRPLLYLGPGCRGYTTLSHWSYDVYLDIAYGKWHLITGIAIYNYTYAKIFSTLGQLLSLLWRRYRGCRAGVKHQAKKRRYKLYLPSIIMGNVRLLANKMDELGRTHGLKKRWLHSSVALAPSSPNHLI